MCRITRGEAAFCLHLIWASLSKWQKNGELGFTVAFKREEMMKVRQRETHTAPCRRGQIQIQVWSVNSFRLYLNRLLVRDIKRTHSRISLTNNSYTTPPKIMSFSNTSIDVLSLHAVAFITFILWLQCVNALGPLYSIRLTVGDF